MSTKLKDYDYILPENLIGQHPKEPRDHSKLMIIDKKLKTIDNKHFYNIVDYLSKGDVLVRNSTKVIPARLYGQKENGLILEVLLVKRISIDTWECLLKPAKKLKLHEKIYIGKNRELIGELLEIKENGNRIIKFEFTRTLTFEEILDSLGDMPLPPYIYKKLEKKDRYQTVYAKKGESIAAPTAGLHFTEKLFDEITAKGVEVVDIFLEVGIGTFRPVKTENILKHNMHEETFEIPEKTAEIINQAKIEGRRIIAVGTTTTRALESSSTSNNRVEPGKKSTNIFIYPGYDFKIVNALITNFHLPKSTLLMLISAFSDRRFILDVYKKAVELEYSFFSFGDAMFIK